MDVKLVGRVRAESNDLMSGCVGREMVSESTGDTFDENGHTSSS